MNAKELFMKNRSKFKDEEYDEDLYPNFFESRYIPKMPGMSMMYDATDEEFFLMNHDFISKLLSVEQAEVLIKYFVREEY